MRDLGKHGQRRRAEWSLVSGECRGDVEASLTESTDAIRVVLQIACALCAEIERRMIVRIRFNLRREVGMPQLAPGEARRLERFRREWNRAPQIFRKSGEIDDAPVRRRKDAIVARDDEDVGVRGEKDLVRREVLVERGEHFRRERIVELIEVQPLPEDAAVSEVCAHAAIELGREQAGDAAHPGIRWLGEDEIEAATARGEVRFRVVEHEVRARVIEDAPVRGIECP